MKNVWTSELLSSISCVSHAFFGRKFDASGSNFQAISSHNRAPHESTHEFNCSKFIGDDLNQVLKNLDAVKNFLGAKKLVTLKQVHGNRCIIADESTECDLEGDALVTKTEGIAIGIATADCTPVVFADPVAKIVGVAHAGWKGAAAGVIQSTIETMLFLGSESENIFACLGPGLSMDNYEVSPDFKENFERNIKETPHLEKCFLECEGKFYFDIPEFCRQTLLTRGIPNDNIDRIKIDTYDNIENFFSYRYERENPGCAIGRFMSAVVLK